MATASQVPKVTLADADGNVYSAAGTACTLDGVVFGTEE